MMEFDKNVPVSCDNKNFAKLSWISQMEIGDSKFVPASEVKPTTIRIWATRAGHKEAKIFVTRSRSEDDIAGTRIWRMQ